MHQTIWAVIVWTLLGACAAVQLGATELFDAGRRSTAETTTDVRLP
jgi:hypothetical protein